MTIVKIDVTKVNKDYLFVSKTGKKMLDLVLMPGRNGKDQYGNDGMVVQGVPKEERAKGVKGAILGNYKEMDFGNRAAAPKPKQVEKPKDDAQDDCPF